MALLTAPDPAPAALTDYHRRRVMGQWHPLGPHVRQTRARVDVQETTMTSTGTSPWALGDYHRFARETVWQVGPVLVEACRIAPGQRVLDVGAGTGNVAIRAAQRGAQVVASDITPQHFAAGRAEADAHGVTVEWVEADAQALPFAAAEFDVVTSAFGAIFAPDHRAVADELLRVCRPGGTIGMANFTPRGVSGEFFELFGRYAPAPPPDALPPTLWGDEDHVRRLFGERARLEMARHTYVERAATPRAYRDFFIETFGPAIAIRASLAADPARQEQFDRDFLDFAVRSDTGRPGGPAEYVYEYLLVVARPLADVGRG
jgi:ubiquinone/menaquinone biosynthesis C-methylase UbiE